MQLLHSNIISQHVWQLRPAYQRYRRLDRLHSPLRFMTPAEQLPPFVRHCPTALEMMTLLQRFPWTALEPAVRKRWFGRTPVPLSAYIGAYLVKIALRIEMMARLRAFLVAHPALVWALGFPLRFDPNSRYAFDPDASLPSVRQLGRMLAQLPTDALAALLDAQVRQMQSRFPDAFAETVSLDTKHIIAWVRENNPHTYVKTGRFDKTQQPAGDPDCKVGCKRQHNRTTPTAEGHPVGQKVSIGEFYWGYASGVVATKVPHVGEFVLAEMTQTFDHGDLTYFFPLMAQVERRLGFRPRYFTADAAFDAFYVYDYFHSPAHDGFAAVPLSGKGGKPTRFFDKAGTPLCDAQLPMTLKFTYNDNTTALIPYRRQKFVCPLLYPEKGADACPIDHRMWPKGGCTSTIAESPGSRIRHQLDREGEPYKRVYKQRTAVERIFSQALALGIERPKLRNERAIANYNSLLYLFINARTLARATDRSQPDNLT